MENNELAIKLNANYKERYSIFLEMEEGIYNGAAVGLIERDNELIEEEKELLERYFYNDFLLAEEAKEEQKTVELYMRIVYERYLYERNLQNGK
ncbi:MAG: hypothetical protein PHF17_00855 [Arcobacteraceae bacterium]|nr:hypothetical protein [Arcobacteraceae bacterium]